MQFLHPPIQLSWQSLRCLLECPRRNIGAGDWRVLRAHHGESGRGRLAWNWEVVRALVDQQQMIVSIYWLLLVIDKSFTAGSCHRRSDFGWRGCTFSGDFLLSASIGLLRCYASEMEFSLSAIYQPSGSPIRVPSPYACHALRNRRSWPSATHSASLSFPSALSSPSSRTPEIAP